MSAVLHVISDRTRRRLPLLEALVMAAKGGADVIQIREKKVPAAETYSFAIQLQEALAGHMPKPALFVNDRVDVAMSANLGGVHLAAKSLPLRAAHELRLQAKWSGKIGCSVHSLEEALVAEQAGADYVTFGHIFATESHPGVPPRGLQTLRRVVNALSIPVIAIGGIDRMNVELVLATGCSGIAVIGAILNAESPLDATRALKDAMLRSNQVHKVEFQIEKEAQSLR